MSKATRDPEGFLYDAQAWNTEIAKDLALEAQVTLTAEHWEIITLLRQYYLEFDSSPAMRALIKYISLHLGKDKATSLYLLKLFPGSPAKISAKIAGLPKPENCL